MIRLALYVLALLLFAAGAYLLLPFPVTLVFIAGALLLCIVGLSNVAHALRTGFIAEDAPTGENEHSPSPAPLFIARGDDDRHERDVPRRVIHDRR